MNGELWWLGVKIVVLTSVACLLVRFFARVPFADLGLRRWSRWSPTEKHFLPQITAITLAVFAFAASSQISELRGRHDLSRILVFICVRQVVWGFHQEFVYRGMLQTELARRWGGWRPILVSNLIFTFGPLHAYHFGLARHHPAHSWIFAAIFAIGLYFAIVYKRSRNLWIVGILHGIGDWFIDGLDIVAGMPR